MNIYISGKITGDANYKRKFKVKQAMLEQLGHNVINPCILDPLSSFLTYEQFMNIDFAMLECCDAVFMLQDWKDSPGAIREEAYARQNGKKIIYENEM